MTRKAAAILALAALVVLLAAVTVAAGQGTPVASEIPGYENQSTARQGNETGTATQAGPCGPACRARQEQNETETVTVTVTITKTVYVVYCPIVLTGSPVTTSPDLLALPAGAE